MERVAELLRKIQKALGDYLERERSNFPRFYFVGDEDLLEIIGNCRDINRLQKHFKKMFSGLVRWWFFIAPSLGIARLDVDVSIMQVNGMVSREGESVAFKRPFSIKDVRINEWLAMVECEMKSTLANLLMEAVERMTIFYQPLPPSVDASSRNALILDILSSLPLQLFILALQIIWTREIEAALSLASAKTNLDALKGVCGTVDFLLSLMASTLLVEAAAPLDAAFDDSGALK